MLTGEPILIFRPDPVTPARTRHEPVRKELDKELTNQLTDSEKALIAKMNWKISSAEGLIHIGGLLLVSGSSPAISSAAGAIDRGGMGNVLWGRFSLLSSGLPLLGASSSYAASSSVDSVEGALKNNGADFKEKVNSKALEAAAKIDDSQNPKILAKALGWDAKQESIFRDSFRNEITKEWSVWPGHVAVRNTLEGKHSTAFEPYTGTVTDPHRGTVDEPTKNASRVAISVIEKQKLADPDQIRALKAFVGTRDEMRRLWYKSLEAAQSSDTPENIYLASPSQKERIHKQAEELAPNLVWLRRISSVLDKVLLSDAVREDFEARHQIERIQRDCNDAIGQIERMRRLSDALKGR